MLNPNDGKFSQNTPSVRRTRQTVNHPEFPEIKNYKQATLLVVNTWNLSEGVWSEIVNPDDVVINPILEPCSKVMIQQRLEEAGFGEVPLNSISAYLSTLNAEGLISKADMKDHISNGKPLTMYCSNRDVEDLNSFHFKFSKLLNDMTMAQLENFFHNHEAGRFEFPDSPF